MEPGCGGINLEVIGSWRAGILEDKDDNDEAN